MEFSSGRMRREAKTVTIMIRRYCRDKHGTDGELCQECGDLLAYAMQRLRACPFQENKTTCGRCAIHCYKPDMRRKMQEVMRTVGPKMLWSNPFLGIMHFLDGFRRKAVRKR